MSFRLDINGLRAYAVILVLLYHFGFLAFKGGFLGVDVFFVISGYLMTGIIASKLEAGNFSLLGFYSSRCKRIIPPLLVMCFLLIIACYFVTPPSEYRTLAKHVGSSLIFISNIVYFKESGYFDSGSIYKWLLHTWSLSVEWQFYLILPLILIAAAKIKNNSIPIIMLVLAVSSLALAIIISRSNGSFAYFMLPTRAWEMLAGGLVYFASKNKTSTNKIIPTIGLAIIITTSMVIDSTTPWPGVATLIPIIATCLIIYHGADNNILLNNQIIQKIGAWSYSIYLYHWPLLVMLNLLGYQQTFVNKISLLVISILLGFTSYYLIERKGYWLTKKTVYILLSATTMCFVSSVIFFSGGLQYRAPQIVNNIANIAQDKNKDAQGCFVINGTTSPQCVFGSKKEKVNLVVLGDSHANALLSSVISSSDYKTDSVVYIAQSSCPTIPGIERRTRPNCGTFVKNSISDIESKYPDAAVLIINRTSLYLHGENGAPSNTPEFSFPGEPSTPATYEKHFEKAVGYLSANRRVFILTPIPEFDYDVIFKMSRDAMIGRKTAITIDKDEYNKRNKDAIAMLQKIVSTERNVTLLDASKELCDDNHCYGEKGGLPLYRDSNHLSESGNKVLTPLFSQMWKEIHKPN
ncbi:acyltransferase family protein [Serratia proteamaculans]|uniref:acyltransferase family protein n=1 Tax=Serratia proteamaculans TaxID=28151 RepID=UPI0039B099AA